MGLQLLFIGGKRAFYWGKKLLNRERLKEINSGYYDESFCLSCLHFFLQVHPKDTVGYYSNSFTFLKTTSSTKSILPVSLTWCRISFYQFFYLLGMCPVEMPKTLAISRNFDSRSLKTYFVSSTSIKFKSSEVVFFSFLKSHVIFEQLANTILINRCFLNFTYAHMKDGLIKLTWNLQYKNESIELINNQPTKEYNIFRGQLVNWWNGSQGDKTYLLYIWG